MKKREIHQAGLAFRSLHGQAEIIPIAIGIILIVQLKATIR